MSFPVLSISFLLISTVSGLYGYQPLTQPEQHFKTAGYVYTSTYILVANTNIIATLTVTRAVKNINTVPMKSTAPFYKQGELQATNTILINSAGKARLETSIFRLQKHHPFS